MSTDGVWIGFNVVILPGVKIGKNSIVGANSVVAKNIPENSIVSGIPAMVSEKMLIKKLSKDTLIYALGPQIPKLVSILTLPILTPHLIA